MAQPSGASEPGEDLCGRVEWDPKVTIRRQSDGRINLELCKKCCLYHCPFCQKSVYRPKADYGTIWTHIEVHKIRGLEHGEFCIYSCKLGCREGQHFHCIFCEKTIRTKRQLEIHLAAHGSDCPSPHDHSHLSTAVGKPALLMLNFPSQVVSTGHSSDLTKSLVDQNRASTNFPVEQNSTTDQRPPLAASSIKPRSPVEQHCKATADPPPASAAIPVQPNPTAVDQHPTVVYCFVKPTGVSDQHSVALAVPVQPAAPVGYFPSYPANTVQQALQISDAGITAKHHLRSLCIDSHHGVYAVSKDYKTAAPVHVIKKRSAELYEMLCKEYRCEVVFQYQKEQGLPYCQCPHLRSVDFCISHARQEDLEPSLLEELVANNLIGKEMKAKCQKHRDHAAQNLAPLVSLVDLGGNHCLYFSVFEPKVTQSSKIGRLFVTYNIRGRFWYCDCSHRWMYCLHKCLAKWYLFQTNRKLFSFNARREAALEIAELMESAPEIMQPPGDESLKQMAKYVYRQKKLPSTLPENLIQSDSEMQFSKQLIPAETVCQECPGQVCLTDPVLITDKARIMTSTGVIKDNSTFLKKCPKCNLMYHYQEWSEGLHNYNSHIILTLQLCTRLHSLIQNHSLADGLVVMLEQTIDDMSSCGMEVLQAYLHFEALQSHKCPSLLIKDLYQKGILNMAGIKIQCMPESIAGEVDTGINWDFVCTEIIRSGLNAHNFISAETNNAIKEAVVTAVTTPIQLSGGKPMNKETEQCHKAVTRFFVKTLQPLSTVESPWFRELTRMLNPKYRPPSRDQLMKTLIPAWYSEEKKQAVQELLGVTEAALTCDRWTNSAHDHYLTVNLHFITKGQMMHKVLCTEPVYDTSAAEAPLLDDILEEFNVRDKVLAMTAENDSSVDIFISSFHMRKLKCFANILSLAAQKAFSCRGVIGWVSKMRAIAVWIRTSSSARNILHEKQKLLMLQQQLPLVGVRSRWDSLYLMVEQFVDQFPAIQATFTDPRLRKAIEEKGLGITDHDQQEAEEFVEILKPLYTSSLCVSAEKSPTCSQIFPILKKLEAHFEGQHEDTPFANTLKETIWGDLSTHYKDSDTWEFLQEASALDPRFKNRINSDAIWQSVLNAAHSLTAPEEVLSDSVPEQHDSEHSEEAPFSKRPRLSALEELFEAEDRALKSCADADGADSIPTRLQQEMEFYRKIPAIPTSEDPLVWWWDRRDELPFLYILSKFYLCIQASSTPHERAFSTDGDALSQERSHVLPDQADLLIFLQKNC